MLNAPIRLSISAGAGALGLLLASPVVASAAQGGHIPVNVCHATSSRTNPYVFITVDASSTAFRGHLMHRNEPNKAGGTRPDRIADYTDAMGVFHKLDGNITKLADCNAGTPGTPGAPGAPGTPGTPGTPGASGTPGAPGASGTPGAPGASGTPGAPGASGTPGAPGASGTPGASGASGTPATPGSAAMLGAPGSGAPHTGGVGEINPLNGLIALGLITAGAGVTLGFRRKAGVNRV